MDNMVFFQRGNTGVVRYRGDHKRRKPGSPCQMNQRMRMANLVNLWRMMPEEHRPQFQNRRNSCTNYNAFMSHNLQGTAIYLTKRQASEYRCVVTELVVAEGTLPPIGLSHDGTAPCTDLKLGNLPIGEETTVRQLTQALVRQNPLLRYGDTLLHYQCLQRQTRDGDPYVVADCHALRLDLSDSRLLTNVVPHSLGFGSRGGLLAATADPLGGMAWVLTRQTSSGTLCSTQRLLCNNPLIAQYSSDEALQAAIRSYGGARHERLLCPKKIDY